MIQTWTIRPHIKGDLFNNRKITFPFNITNCKVDMQFKQSASNMPVFSWSTEDATFEKNGDSVIMKSRILDFTAGNYISDLQVTFADGTVQTYFKANLQILQDITR